MLVVLADRLNERDRGQGPVVEAGEEVFLVLEVLRLRGRAVGVLLKVDEGLVVEFEGLCGLAGQRVVPSSSLPGPRHPGST